MSRKHDGWHKNWAAAGGSRIRHLTGLEFERVLGAGGEVEEVHVVAVTLDKFAVAEAARGVPEHDLPGRIERLAKEAVRWRERR